MNPFARIPNPVRVLLFLTVALPFAVGSLVASSRYGAEHRLARSRLLSAAADSLVLAVGGAEPGEPALVAAAGRGFPAVVYRRDPAAGESFRRVAARPSRFGESGLTRHDARALLEQGGTVAGRPAGGSLTVVAPFRDPAGAITGALLLADTAAAPPVLPTSPVAFGLIALTALLFAAAAYAERPTRARALLVYLPGLAFFGWLLLGAAPAAGGGGYRAWAGALAVAWATLASYGLARLYPRRPRAA